MSVRFMQRAARRRSPRAILSSTVALIAATIVMAAPAGAQQAMRSPIPPLWFRPLLGAFVPTGQQRNLLDSSILTGAQLQWNLTPRWALTGTYAWTPSHNRTTTQPSNPLFMGDQAPVNVRQWNAGVQAYLADVHHTQQTGDWYVRPFLGAGLGGRTYRYTQTTVVRETVGQTSANDFEGYGALGADFSRGGEPLGIHLELRDDVSRFKGTYAQLATSTTRNDLMLVLGVNMMMF